MTMLMSREEQAVEQSLDTRYLEVADTIGRRLVRDAVWAGDRCGWLMWTQEPFAGALRPVFKAAGADLYMGAAGIGLFLAHLSTVTHDGAQRDAARGAARRVREELVERPPALAGFYTGAAGGAWALARIGAALGDDGLVRDGVRLLREAAERAPAGLHDLLAGDAGIVLALVDAGERYGAPELLDVAERLAERLVATAVRSAEGLSWPTGAGESRHLLGLSHGTTGIALALLELHRARPDDRWRQTALGALAYERALFDPRQRNWPDFRTFPGVPAGSGPAFPVAWCHGATGVGIARLRMHDLLPDDPRVLPEVDAAIANAVAALNAPVNPLSTDFSLCHGATGNSELLLLVGERFGRAEAVAAARRVGDVGYETFHRPRLPWACGIQGCGETPSLLTGTAGIGMHYLRLYDPAAMPSILLPHVSWSARDEQAPRTT
jgi:lantibiotic modifying enzyme